MKRDVVIRLMDDGVFYLLGRVGFIRPRMVPRTTIVLSDTLHLTRASPSFFLFHFVQYLQQYATDVGNMVLLFGLLLKYNTL